MCCSGFERVVLARLYQWHSTSWPSRKKTTGIHFQWKTERINYNWITFLENKIFPFEKTKQNKNNFRLSERGLVCSSISWLRTRPFDVLILTKLSYALKWLRVLLGSSSRDSTEAFVLYSYTFMMSSACFPTYTSDRLYMQLAPSGGH